MKKIFAFVVNEDKKLLLLKGSSNDPQFHKSFWYTVTGGVEDVDNSLEDTVKREIKEETNLDTISVKYLDWIFEYESLGEHCTEYVHVAYVKNGDIVLNEESIDYKWCDKEEYIQMIEWDEDKEKLIEVINAILNRIS